MNNNRVSIIVPVYNSEAYLRKCINSILSQTYENFELIIINDGSIDNSKKICEDYLKKDSRIVLINQKNMGVSVARNKGIDISKGDYIIFIDSDDYIKSNYIEIMMQYSKNSDLVVSGYTCNGKPLYEVKEQLFENDIANNCLNSHNHGLFLGPVCKLYKSSIIKQNSIYFSNKLSYGEDICFNINYLQYCESVNIIDYYGYEYLQTDNSLSRKYIDNVMEQLDCLNDIVYNSCLSKEIKQFWLIRNFKLCVNKYAYLKYKDYKVKMKKLTENLYYIMINNKYLNLKDSLINICIKYRLYLIIYLYYHKRVYKN